MPAPPSVAETFSGTLQSAWTDLVTPHAGPVEQFAWWQACVEGLPGVGRIRPFCVNAHGKTQAIAPLVLRPGPLPCFELIGVRQLHEPMDFVYSSPETLAVLCDQLASQKIPLSLLRVPQDSPLLEQLRRAYQGRGLLLVSNTTPYPFLELDASWRTPDTHFNAGRRSDLRRAMRHAEKNGVVQFELLTPQAATLEPLLAEAYDTELHNWKGRRGSALATDTLRGEFYRRYFQQCTEEGILRLAFMRVDGVAVAMQIGVLINNRLWLLKIGYHEAYARMSPGTLLMREVVRQAAESGVQSIEFLGAVEPWTQTWTNRERHCVHIRSYPFGFLSGAVFVADTASWLTRQIHVGGKMSTNKLRLFAKEQLSSASRYLSRAYIAGPELPDALTAFDRFASHGQSGTIGYFNPARQPAAEIAHIDRAAIASLSTRRGDGYVSIKAPPLGFDTALIEEIARQSAGNGVGIHFDSHAIETTDPTFACIAAAQRHTDRLGCTLPARWPRSLQDADQAIALKLRVRVVKGQWADPEHPDQDLNATYLRLIDRLAGKARQVAVATHDPILAREALRRLQAAGTPCELEQLLGLPIRTVSTIARNMGVPVRIYIPFGTAWLPYALTQLAKKPGTLWWLMKDALMAAMQGRRSI